MTTHRHAHGDLRTFRQVIIALDLVAAGFLLGEVFAFSLVRLAMDLPVITWYHVAGGFAGVVLLLVGIRHLRHTHYTPL
jgi:hypothetical protein